MISYPFISGLFGNILSKSKGIEGRFFLCPKMGQEVSSDELGVVIKDLVIPKRLDKKYPLCLMMPPVSYGNYNDHKGEWVNYVGILFFLTSSYSSGVNQIKSANVNTRTSTHTIEHDWHDMARCAANFVRVLGKVQLKLGLINDRFRLDQNRDVQIMPVSGIGADNAAGVKLEFYFSVFSSCEVEDYDEEDIDAIVAPVNDPHPEHKL